MGMNTDAHGGFAGGRLLLVLALTLTSCDDDSFSRLQELSTNRALWERVEPAAYVYAVQRRCFCGSSARGPVRVTVVAGEVVERRYVESGDPVPEELRELFPSVDGLFEVLFEAYRREAHSIEALYDPDTGVPLDFFIDYEENVADEELGFEVTELVTAL